MHLWVEPAALDEIVVLPGHVRQRIRYEDLRELLGRL